MWVRSEMDQVATVRDLGISVPFESGEEILTEISEEFTAKRVRNELESADLVVAATHWTDGSGDFLVTLALPYC
jgi:L-histidine Nalpha-methyltransferase